MGVKYKNVSIAPLVAINNPSIKYIIESIATGPSIKTKKPDNINDIKYKIFPVFLNL